MLKTNFNIAHPRREYLNRTGLIIMPNKLAFMPSNALVLHCHNTPPDGSVA